VERGSFSSRPIRISSRADSRACVIRRSYSTEFGHKRSMPWVLVKATTVLKWHRRGFRLAWRWRSGPRRPRVASEVRGLIRQMCTANPLWAAPRIHGELLKFGIEVSQALCCDLPRSPSKTGRRVVHFDVATNPTQAWARRWLVRQITEAFPWDTVGRVRRLT
jgi:putative transposase